MIMMTVYRISTCHYIDDLSGEGAFLHGARWNSPGTRVLYAAENAALAMLEALAHITMLPVKQPFCLLRLSIPNDIASIDVASLPPDWKQQPPPDTLRKYGDVFAANGEALALKVPSVLVPDNFNFLINPHHALFSKIKKIAVSNISFDQRLFSTKS
jgi:RES domain-containing protein